MGGRVESREQVFDKEPLMELRHLRYFVVVAEELSFRKAAKRLHVAEPPLGRQIRDLEEEIGTLLFDRSRNHVALTEAGKAFLAGTRKTLQAANQAVDAARKATRPVEISTLRIGRFGLITASFLPQSLAIYKRTHPQIKIHLFGMDPKHQLDALVSGELDLAFVAAFDLQLKASFKKEIATKQILESPILVILPTSHPLVFASDSSRGDKPVRVTLLAGEKFLRFTASQNASYSTHLVRACRERGGFRPRFGAIGSDDADLINLVAEGEGIFFEPAFVFAEVIRRLHASSLGSRVVGRSTNLPAFKLVAAWSKRHPSPLAPEFLECVQSALVAES
jgi:DNA-binding transcriptional LysR family regulator